DGETPGQSAIAEAVARGGRGAILREGDPSQEEERPMKRPVNELIAHGVVGGFLAGLVVALWFLLVDSLAGRPFHTPAVLASVLSGFVLMAYLHRAAREQRPLGLAALKGYPLLAQGVVTGLVGAAVVALWFLALDVAAGQLLRTPAALGAALLFGASNVAAIQVNLGIVAAYTAVHVAAFEVAGTVVLALPAPVASAA